MTEAEKLVEEMQALAASGAREMTTYEKMEREKHELYKRDIESLLTLRAKEEKKLDADEQLRAEWDKRERERHALYLQEVERTNHFKIRTIIASEQLAALVSRPDSDERGPLDLVQEAVTMADALLAELAK